MAAVPEDVVEACARFRQGDLFADPPLVRVADLSYPITKESRRLAQESKEAGEELGLDYVEPPFKFGVIVSQTCDLRSDERPNIKIAPAIEIDPSTETRDSKVRFLEGRIRAIEAGMHVHKVARRGRLHWPQRGRLKWPHLASVDGWW